MLLPIGAMLVVFLVALTSGALLACGSSSQTGEQVDSTWSASHAAQRDFHRLVTQWSAMPAAQRVTLEPMFVDFLRRYSTDGHARVAAVYLAWIDVQKGNLLEAQRLAKQAQGKGGVVYDFAAVVRGAILIRQKLPDQALRVLEPLRGKIIDPAERVLFGGELVRAAMLSKRYDSAIGYMVDWVDQAPDSEVETVQSDIERLLHDAPVNAMESGLAALESEAAVEAEGSKSSRAAARDWLKKAVRNHLVSAAIAQQDVSLAKRLLDATPPTFRRDDTSDALARLASEGRVEPRVQGRAVGVVLRLSDDESRRRASQVISGISRGLGLPDSSTDPEAVRLITEDAGDEPGAVQEALAALAGEGAAILVAVVGEKESASAVAFAEGSKIPVLLLDDYPTLTAALDYTFVLGIDWAKANEVAQNVAANGRLHSPVVIGAGGVPCRTSSLANEPPFPILDWKKNHVDALVLLGEGKCSRNAIAEADRYKLAATLVIGLASAELYSSLGTRAMLVESTGSFPSGLGPVPASMQQWQARLGAPPAWYEALGYDTAVLAKEVLAQFPLDRSDDAKKVTELHRKARDNLSKASVDLWTSERKGFSGTRRLLRDLRLVTPPGGAR